MQSSVQTSDTAPESLSGAQMVVEALHREGVEHVFGYPGGAVLPLYDAFYRQTYFKHILVRHEQAALHMADAYARSTGKVGVAVCDAVTAAVFQYFHLHIAAAGNAVVALQRLVRAGCKCKFPGGEFG